MGGHCMADMIGFLMENFTLTFLVIGVVFSLVAISRAPRPLSAPVVVEKIFFWFLFFSASGAGHWVLRSREWLGGGNTWRILKPSKRTPSF